jgi:prevent-host-death family protein
LRGPLAAGSGDGTIQLVDQLVEVAVDTVGAFEAKTKLSELLDLVERGSEITITRRGEPVARLVPISRSGDEKARVKALIEEIKEPARGSRSAVTSRSRN